MDFSFSECLHLFSHCKCISDTMISYLKKRNMFSEVKMIQQEEGIIVVISLQPVVVAAAQALAQAAVIQVLLQWKTASMMQ